MAIIKKVESEKIYISNRLNNRLKTILEAHLTIVEAPTGYGKSTVIKEYLNKTNVDVIWFSIDSSDKDAFITDFSNRMKALSEETAETIRNIGFPKDDKSSMLFAKSLFEIEFMSKTLLVLDNYHLISDEFINKVIKDIAVGKNENLNVICLTQDINSNVTFDLVLEKKLNYINKADFALSMMEIDDYFKLCGIKLTEEEVEVLYKYTEGWISALYLQMLSYVSSGKFETSVDVEKLINNAIYKHLNRKQQDFLIATSVFGSFSFRQAVKISGNILSEDDIEELLNNNAFIEYYAKTRKYYLHSMFKIFLEQEFENQELTFKKEIYRRAGDWYRDNEEYFNAIKYYHNIKDYDAILGMKYSGAEFIREMNSANTELFLSILKNITTEQKKNNLNQYMILLYALYAFNQKDLFINECKLVKSIIEDMKNVGIDASRYEGEYEILNSLTKFNNIDEMYKSFDKAYKILGTGSKLFVRDNSFMQYNPSIMAMFHYGKGKLDEELDKIDTFMPLYYKLFDGASKGAEALMRAEVLLNRGDFSSAALLCKKALYMAESRNQLDIYITANFYLARIACFENNYDEINKIFAEVTKRLKTQTNKELMVMSDLCESFLRIALDTPLLVKLWLTDYSTIESKCRIHNLGFANVIYGKYLLVNEKYEDLLAISGEMLNIANIFGSIIYLIYTYIYICICNLNLNNDDKASKFLIEAIELAVQDDIVVPFLENYDMLSAVVPMLTDNEYIRFMDNIKQISRKYSRNLHASKKAAITHQSYGLTKRETDVAKLAAKRYSNKEIAEELFIAESTVKSNLKVVYSKLNINSRSQLKNYFEE